MRSAREYTNALQLRRRGFHALAQSARKTGCPGPRRILGPVQGRTLRYETHLPTQEAQASENPRIQGENADAGRAPDAQAPACEGPQATDGLMAGTAGARAGHRAHSVGSGRARLSRSGDFDRVFRQGRSHAARELVLYVFPRDSEDPPRLGLSVSRKVGGAVERNRVKRMLREAFAEEGSRLPAGTDAVLVARPDAGALVEREGLPGVTTVLRDLVARALPDSARGETSESRVEGEPT